MEKDKEFNPLKDFDFEVLRDPEFKEDSVREEIIYPILKFLGYKASGPNKIIRSRTLEHPYVSIGSTKRKLSIIPDYLLEVDRKAEWVLDAKSPFESIEEPKHLSQVYTYAIHRDVRVDTWAICNGWEFAIYKTGDMSNVPRLKVGLNEQNDEWALLFAYLNANAIRKERLKKAKADFKKDLGIMLLKLKLNEIEEIDFINIPVCQISCMGANKFEMMSFVTFEKEIYLGSFELNRKQLKSIVSRVSGSLKRDLNIKLLKRKATVVFPTPMLAVSLKTNISGRIREVDFEHFAPISVIDVFIVNQLPACR